MRRSRTIISILAVVAMGAAACSSSSSTGPRTGERTGAGTEARTGARTTHLTAYQLVSASPAKTEAAKTAKLAIRARFTGIPQLQSMRMDGGGVMNLQTHRADIALNVPTPQGTFGMREIIDGTTFYMQMPGQIMRRLPGNASWIKVDLGALTGGNALGGLGSWQQVDPSQMLEYLEGVSSSVSDEGAGTVRGVAVRRYRVVIDPQKALQKLPSSLRCGFKAQTRRFGGLHIPAVVSIDEQGRLRRMALFMHVPARAGLPRAIGMNMTMDMFGFGAPVNIAVPSPSEVFDLTTRMGSELAQACPGTSTT
jgi:hypothetical protein